jgi:hypothetical protein
MHAMANLMKALQKVITIAAYPMLCISPQKIAVGDGIAVSHEENTEHRC